MKSWYMENTQGVTLAIGSGRQSRDRIGVANNSTNFIVMGYLFRSMRDGKASRPERCRPSRAPSDEVAHPSVQVLAGTKTMKSRNQTKTTTTMHMPVSRCRIPYGPRGMYVCTRLPCDVTIGSRLGARRALAPPPAPLVPRPKGPLVRA